ncbi:MAG TPA: YigZ family protein [Thermoanaerobaculia bacterium]|jgi:uncharacterized YigZ family protein|nr:YigZ family protein [Thermoanaerobaculia bacterium]
MSDHYQTLANRVELRHKVERSEFLGLAFPCASEEEFFVALSQIGKKYFDATHHCWAFRLLSNRQRSSDAGEPAGTAGKPILSAIEGADVFDVAIVVVRWFGGVKLGTGGLSRAYRGTAAETLRRGEIVERFLYDTIRVEVPFESISAIYRLINPPHVKLIDESFGEKNVFTIDVRRSRTAEVEAALAQRRLTFSRATPP